MSNSLVPSTESKPLISNRMYNLIKWTAQYGLPAVGTLYFALASIWGLPYGEQVVGTITALTIFLGVLQGLSTRAYNASEAKYDGALVVNTEDPTKDIYSFEVASPLDELRDKQELTIKVQKTE